MEKMQKKILELLEDIQPDYDFANGTDFVEQGWLDSFDVVTLVASLEQEFGVAISALEILPENFSSLEAIAELVKKSKKLSS